MICLTFTVEKFTSEYHGRDLVCREAEGVKRDSGEPIQVVMRQYHDAPEEVVVDYLAEEFRADLERTTGRDGGAAPKIEINVDHHPVAPLEVSRVTFTDGEDSQEFVTYQRRVLDLSPDDSDDSGWFISESTGLLGAYAGVGDARALVLDFLVTEYVQEQEVIAYADSLMGDARP